MKNILKTTIIAILATATFAATTACAQQEPIVFPTPLPTATPFVLPSPLPTATPVTITFPTPLPTTTPIALPSPLPTSTPAPTATAIAIPDPLPTATPVVIRYPTPRPTSTPTILRYPTPLPTATPTILGHLTQLPTATPAPTATPLPTPFANIDLLMTRRIVAIETRYVDYPSRKGTAWPASAHDGKTCLVTARHVAAAHTEKHNGHDVPIFSSSTIISREQGHYGTRSHWVVAGGKPFQDLAVLSPQSPINLPVWELAPENAEIRVGDPIRVVGYDFIDGGAMTQHVTSGIISYVSPDDADVQFIRFDANIQDGTAGGVILNSKLQVIAMVMGTRGPGLAYGLHINPIRHTLESTYLQC